MKHALTTLYGAYRHPVYLIIFLLSSTILLGLILWLPNLSLLKAMLSSPRLSIGEKIGFLFGALRNLQTGFSPLSRFPTTLLIILFGLNNGFLAYSIRQRLIPIRALGKNGMGALLLALGGSGCTSCGSLLFSLLGITGTLAFLPLKGAELSFISVILLALSLNTLIKTDSEGIICRPKRKNSALQEIIVEQREKISGRPGENAQTDESENSRAQIA